MSNSLHASRLSTILLGCALAAAPLAAQSATLAFTDRDLWAAAAGAFVTEDFDGLPLQALPANGVSSLGLITFQTTNTSPFTQIEDGFGSRNIDESNHLQALFDGSPVRSGALIFPAPILAWGMDYNQIGDQTFVSFLEEVPRPVGPHNSSGFIGFVSDTPFTQVTLTDPYLSFSAIGIDNISFKAVPEPTTWAASVLALLGGLLRRRRFKVKPRRAES